MCIAADSTLPEPTIKPQRANAAVIHGVVKQLDEYPDLMSNWVMNKHLASIIILFSDEQR